MNKRQKKKLFKKRIGNNPRKELVFKSECYYHIIGKPWTGKSAVRQQGTQNIDTFNRAMAERRKKWKTGWNRP